MPQRLSMWAHDGLFVDLVLGDDGTLTIHGQHLANGGEYEYAVVVAQADVPVVAAALGGSVDDVVDLLVQHAGTIITTGEVTWLKALGVTPRFWSRHD